VRSAPGSRDIDQRLFTSVEDAEAELRAAVNRLEAGRAGGVPLHELRKLHAEVQRAFARATEAARALLNAEIAAHGGGRKAFRSAEVRHWQDYLNVVRTLRERHRMEQADDHGVMVPSAVQIGTRAAHPMQAGTEFEPEDLVAARLRQPRIGVDLEDVVDAVSGPVAHPALPDGRVVDSNPSAAVD
jgi:hypothetical protein